MSKKQFICAQCNGTIGTAVVQSITRGVVQFVPPLPPRSANDIFCSNGHPVGKFSHGSVSCTLLKDQVKQVSNSGAELLHDVIEKAKRKHANMGNFSVREEEEEGSLAAQEPQGVSQCVQGPEIRLARGVAQGVTRGVAQGVEQVTQEPHGGSSRKHNPNQTQKEKTNCAFYLLTGNCNYGQECKFLHPPRDGANSRPTSSQHRRSDTRSQSHVGEHHKRADGEKHKNPHHLKQSLDTWFKEDRIAEILELASTSDFTKVVDISITPYDCEMIVKILVSPMLLQSQVQELVNMSYTQFLNSQMVKEYLPKYVRQHLHTESQMRDVCKLFEEAMRRCPEKASLLCATDLCNKTKSHPSVHENALRISKLQEQIEKDSGGHLLQKQDFAPLEEDFREISLYPQLSDFNQQKSVVIDKLPCISVTGYPTVDHMLYTNFKLTREDFVEAIRDGLDEVRKSQAQNQAQHRFTDLPVYKNVRIIGQTLKLSGDIMLKVTFKTDKPIDTIGKLLMPGNLLILFPMPTNEKVDVVKLTTDIEPIAFTISAVDSDKRGKIRNISITPCREEDLEDIDFDMEYVMLESPSYFRAIEPVLECLQQIENLPFADVLIGQTLDPKPPRYILLNPDMELDCIMKGKQPAIINVTGQNWPSHEHTIFDQSQFEAFKHIMNHRVAVIQGPPGTGKTYLGSHTVKAILKNQNCKAPIICIFYTNHALDSFLESIIDDVPELVRIGGSSKSERLKSRNIYNITDSRRTRDRRIRQIDYDLHGIRETLEKRSNGDATFRSLINATNDFKRRILFTTRMGTIINFKSVSQAFKVWITGAEDEYNKKKKKEKKKGNTFELLQDTEGDSDIIALKPENESDVKQKEHDFRQEQDVFMKQHGIAFTPEDDGIEKEEFNEEDITQNEQESLVEENDDQSQVEDAYDFEEEERRREFENIVAYEAAVSIPLEVFESRVRDDVEQSICNAEGEEQDLYETTRKLLINRLDFIANDLWKYPVKERQRIVDSIETGLKSAFNECTKSLLQSAHALIKERTTYIEREKRQLLQSVPLIGFTSTGAAMNRNLIQRLNPRVMVIVEAGELLESHVLAIIPPKLEHLIMIGDEKQLRPKVNSYDLEVKKKFAISLFERLVMMNIATTSLTVQLRMRPEISMLVKPFYKSVQIQDHARVFEYPDVKGMAKNVAFICHSKPESSTGRSKTNVHEAQFTTKLAQYLLNVGDYTAGDITVITPYEGQMFLLKQHFAAEKITKGVHIVTIDDFQGEENKIIILSLVRSNPQNAAGFVSIQNRIIVSLSRAKHGLYIIGNDALLSSQKEKDDWYGVLKHLEDAKQKHPYIEVVCPNHPKNILRCTHPSDFDAVSHGGCSIPCTFAYDCGHLCSRKCHAADIKHQKLRCTRGVLWA